MPTRAARFSLALLNLRYPPDSISPLLVTLNSMDDMLHTEAVDGGLPASSETLEGRISIAMDITNNIEEKYISKSIDGYLYVQVFHKRLD